MTLQTYLGHDAHAHPLQSYPGCSGIVQTSLSSGHGAEANVFAVFEATYTDNGGAGGSAPLTGRALEQLQPKRKQAEYFAATGRVPDGLGGGDPGVVRETTGDTRAASRTSGSSRTGLVVVRAHQPGQHRQPAVPDGIGRQRRPHRDPKRLTGRHAARHRDGCRAPAAGSPSGTNVTAAQPEHDLRPAVLRGKNPVGDTGTAVVFNVNWVDFLGRGVTDNAPPVVTVSATPTAGTSRCWSPSPARRPMRRATSR